MPRPWPTTPPSTADRAAHEAAVSRSYWLDALPHRTPSPALRGRERTSLCIVGGGFTGLWAAIHAKADDPGRDVVLLEGDMIGGAASGRNGGFCVASLTHGLSNGLTRFPEELSTLERLGRENYDGLLADVARLGIACDLEQTGELTVALEPHQLEWLQEEADLLARHGHDAVLLSREELRASVASPTYLGGVWDRTAAAILDPGKLAEGLRRAAVAAGVRIHEGSSVDEIERTPQGLRVITGPGVVDADRVLLATGAHPSLVGAVRARIAPVYDYVLVTEPLGAEQLAAVGWADRQGIGDSANQFHYYRLT
ncbi:MAG: FAD-dependent oxidoreductase, partial [Solirubrobacteraceae bacterium]|nr:FAD-dependent oxidoreductase [Solirubrobacteraceae bacterium]